MNTIVAILIIVAVLIVGLAVWFMFRQQRSSGLRERFGPEYERGIAATDSRRAVESDLREREKRYSKLDIRPLTDAERTRFADSWTTVQQGFVDDPGQAVRAADGLFDDVMRARGYPLDDFEQRAADISVEHPIVVQRYRRARGIADAHRAGRAGTEDLRQAVTSYRALIDALLEPGPVDGPSGGHGEDGQRAADEPRLDSENAPVTETRKQTRA